MDEIVLKGMGGAISNTVTIAELLKGKIENLHQITEIGSAETTQVYQPLYQGLDKYILFRVLNSFFSHILDKKFRSLSPICTFACLRLH